MAALKGSPKVRAVVERITGLNSKMVDNSIKDSPAWIMVRTYKPAFILYFLMSLISATENHRISQLNRLLADLTYSDYMEKWKSSKDKPL